MPVALTGLRIFIASPGGLENERRSFRSTLLDYNSDDAHERGVNFIPSGWELTIAGLGRPQELINEEVRRSDYLVLVLWDRWGSAPSEGGPYTSGTEEEYNIARECLDPGNPLPMKDIVVLFKGVDERQLSDPGEELRKVLAFKKQLEEERPLLYSSFDSLAEFEREIRRHLQRWTRDQEHGQATESRRPPPTLPPSRSAVAALPAPSGDLVVEAEALAAEGRLAEAEERFAQAIASRTEDAQALGRYAVFLRRNGRLAHAEAMDERLLRLGERLGDASITSEALGNLAIAKRMQGELAKATDLLSQAVDIAEVADLDADRRAFLHDNLGLTLRRTGAFDRALTEHRAALALRSASDDKRGMASSLNNIGYIFRETGQLDQALQTHRQALTLFEEVDDKRGLAAAHANLGQIFERRGEFSDAEREYRLSLAFNEEMRSADGMGMNFSQLSRILVLQDHLDEASDFARRCLEINERAGNREGIASALHAIGRVELGRSKYNDAIKTLTAANEEFASIGLQTGIAGTLRDLAVATYLAGNVTSAEHLVTRAEQAVLLLNHPQLKAEVAAARKLIDSTEN